MTDLEKYGDVVQDHKGNKWRLLEILKMNENGDWLGLVAEADGGYPQSVKVAIIPNDLKGLYSRMGAIS